VSYVVGFEVYFISLIGNIFTYQDILLYSNLCVYSFVSCAFVICY